MHEDQHTDDMIRTEDADVFQPVPVKVEHTAPVAPDFGTWQTYILTAGQPSQQILPVSRKRKRALIRMTDACVLGSQAQTSTAQTGTSLQGAYFPLPAAGGFNQVEYTASQSVWAVATAAQVFISVLDERYQ